MNELCILAAANVATPEGNKAINLLFVAIFYLIAIGVGLWAGRRSATGNSAEDLLLAGRRLPMLVCVFTLTATWVGGGYINGVAEQIYQRGFVWTQAPWSYALSLILGMFVFTKVMHKHKFTTMLDPFERRYGKAPAALMAIPPLLGEVFWSAAILLALGSTFAVILDFPLQNAIVISAAVAIVYTLFGGLWSVAYTDVIQVILILGGLCLALPYALDQTGGLSATLNHYPSSLPPEVLPFSDRPWPPMEAFSTGGDWGLKGWVWLDEVLLLICGGIAWQIYFQRILACKDARMARKVSLYSCVGVLVLAIPPVLIGMIGATMDWEGAGLPAPQEASMILPHVLKFLAPSFIGLLGLSAVAAAVMSSIDSSILSGSSMVTWNVYRPLFRPKASDRELRLVIRISVIAVGTLATLLALSLKSVYALWFLCSDLVYVILFPQLLMALYFKRANVIGAAAGVMVAIVLRLGGGEAAFGLEPFISYPMQDDVFNGQSMFPFRTAAMLANAATIIVVSLLTTRICAPKPIEATSENEIAIKPS